MMSITERLKRLKKISDNVSLNGAMSTHLRLADLLFLIEQAERVQELEEEMRSRDSTVKAMDSMALHREDRLMSALKSKSSYRKQRNKLEKKVEELEQKLKRCCGVLKFYADPNNYEEIDQYMSNINVDSGSRARRELEANEDE